MDVKQTLKRWNRLPFPLTLKHYVSFGKGGEELAGTLRSGTDWMVLRNQHARYRIAEERDAWLADLALDGEKDGQDAALIDRVRSLIALMKKERMTTLYSVGSGGAVFEYYLKREAPEIRVIVTECTDAGVERLKRVFTEADDVERFDALRAQEWERIGTMSSTLVFIYRNEREFTDTEWRGIFRDMYATGVDRVFLGLMWTLTGMALLTRFVNNTKRTLAGERLSFVGYIRSLAALRRFWKGKYTEREEIYFPTCTGLYLTRITSPI